MIFFDVTLFVGVNNHLFAINVMEEGCRGSLKINEGKLKLINEFLLFLTLDTLKSILAACF